MAGPVYSSAVTSWTPTATADGSQLTASGYHALRSAAALDIVKITEISVEGEATSSTVNANALRRHTTNSTTPTNRTPAPLSITTGGATAATAQGFITASTNPTVAALATVQHVLNLSYNAFGGFVRWVAYPGEEVYIAGTTANNSEISISTVTGTGVQSTHFIFEEVQQISFGETVPMGMYYKVMFKVDGASNIELDIPNGYGTEFASDAEGNTLEIKHREYAHIVSDEESIWYLEDEAIEYMKKLPDTGTNREYSFTLTPL